MTHGCLEREVGSAGRCGSPNPQDMHTLFKSPLCSLPCVSPPPPKKHKHTLQEIEAFLLQQARPTTLHPGNMAPHDTGRRRKQPSALGFCTAGVRNPVRWVRVVAGRCGLGVCAGQRSRAETETGWQQHLARTLPDKHACRGGPASCCRTATPRQPNSLQLHQSLSLLLTESHTHTPHPHTAAHTRPPNPTPSPCLFRSHTHTVVCLPRTRTQPARPCPGAGCSQAVYRQTI